MSRRSASDAWSWRHAIARSDLPGTTKHVLYALSIFMNEAGQSCFPAIENGKGVASAPDAPLDLVTATGLSKRAIIKHLADACEAGWLKRARHGFQGQRWKRFEYEPQWPGRELPETADLESGDPGAPRRGIEVVTAMHERGDPRSPEVVTDVHRDNDQSTDQSNTSPDSRESAHAQEEKPDRLGLAPVIDEAEVGEAQTALERIWPPGAIGNRLKTRSLLVDMTPEDRKAAVDAAPRFLRSRRDEKRTRNFDLSTYLAGRNFELHPDPTPQATEPTITLKPWTVELWVLFWRAFEAARKSGETREAGRLDARILNLRTGLTTPTAAIPSADDIRALVPVKIGEEQHAAWAGYCLRHGVELPKPGVVPVVYVPAGEIPGLSLGWKGYRLAKPARCVFRSREWWWRLHRAGDRQIVEALLREGGRSQGAIGIDLGPWPLPTEAASMVEVHRNTDPWDAWELWFERKGVYLLWPESSIWCPTEYPPSQVDEKAKEKAA